MTLRILVVCEAASDFRTAADLADRVLLERVDWLDETLLPSVRQWRAFGPDHCFLTWGPLGTIAEQLGLRRLRPRSRFNGELGAPDAAAADLALQLAAFLARTEAIAAVLLIRDTDKYEARRRGLEQARVLDDGRAWPFRVVLGVAHPKREAWVLAGFEPQDTDEMARFESQRGELGHDPCAHSERLTARTRGADRDAKRVLHALTASNFEREALCWRQTSLDRLKERGQENGLAAYLAEVETHLVPLLSPQ